MSDALVREIWDRRKSFTATNDLLRNIYDYRYNQVRLLLTRLFVVHNDELDDQTRQANIKPAIDTVVLFQFPDPRFQKWLSIGRPDFEVVEMALCDAWQQYPVKHREYLEIVRSYGIRVDVPRLKI
jgi:hypothetical protein